MLYSVSSYVSQSHSLMTWTSNKTELGATAANFVLSVTNETFYVYFTSGIRRILPGSTPIVLSNTLVHTQQVLFEVFSNKFE